MKRLELAGQKFNRLIAINYSHTNNDKKSVWNCVCDCGKNTQVTAKALKSGSTKSCGCLKTETTSERSKGKIKGQKFGRLLVLEEKGINSHGKLEWVCLCDCGNTTIAATSNLTTGNTSSCGCFHKEIMKERLSGKLEGAIFGRLKVIKSSHTKILPNGKGKLVWKCLCECGRYSYVDTNRLNFGNARSCGNCLLKKKGVSTSYKALEIHKFLNNRGVHNYKTKAGPIVDIALVINNTKIAIEYNEWYWHGNKQDKDIARTQNLVDQGWKVLNINANKNLPTQEQIDDCINYLLKCANSVNLVLPNWGEGLCR